MVDLRHLKRYSQICSLLSHLESEAVLLAKGEKRGLGVVGSAEAHQGSFQGGMLLSANECDFIKKRSIFMEKLRSNESKYDASLGRMS